MKITWRIEHYTSAMGVKLYEVTAIVGGRWTRITQPMESESDARLALKKAREAYDGHP